MIVTDKKYHIETRLVKKLDLMIDRMDDRRRKDNLLIVEGSEGDGKSNVSVAVGYYIAHMTGRSFGNENMFFDVSKMIDVAKKKDRQVLIWDEPALSGLTVEWWRRTQINLTKLLMVARKRRHFFIFNFTKFHKFNEYIVVDRAIGMIHVYERYTKTGGIQQGRFAYFKQKSLQDLYYYWRSTKRRAYKKYRDFMGAFPWVLPKIIDEEKYEEQKDEAILSVGVDELSKWHLELFAIQYRIAMMEGVDKKTKAKALGVTERTLYNWGYIPKKYPEVVNLLRNKGFEVRKGKNIL